jgi:hypothetical protein
MNGPVHTVYEWQAYHRPVSLGPSEPHFQALCSNRGQHQAGQLRGKREAPESETRGTAPSPARPPPAIHGHRAHKPQLRQYQTRQQVGFSQHRPTHQQTESGSECPTITGSMSTNPGPHTGQDSGTTPTNTGETPPSDASCSLLPIVESSYNSTTATPRICNCDSCAKIEQAANYDHVYNSSSVVPWKAQ